MKNQNLKNKPNSSRHKEPSFKENQIQFEKLAKSLKEGEALQISYSVEIPIFRGKLVIEYCSDMIAVYGDKNSHVEALAFSDRANQEYRIVFGMTDSTPGAIAHECLHLIKDLIRDKGIVEDPNSGYEVECYLLTWLVDTITEKYEEMKKNYAKAIEIAKLKSSYMKNLYEKQCV